MLAYFQAHAGEHLTTRSQLSLDLCQIEYDGQDRTIDVRIARLRAQARRRSQTAALDQVDPRRRLPLPRRDRRIGSEQAPVFRWYVRTALMAAPGDPAHDRRGRTFLEPSAERLALDLVGGHATRIARQVAEAPPADRRDVVEALERWSPGCGVGIEPARTGPSPHAEWRASGLFVTARAPGRPARCAWVRSPRAASRRSPKCCCSRSRCPSAWPGSGRAPSGVAFGRSSRSPSGCARATSPRAPATDGDVFDVIARSSIASPIASGSSCRTSETCPERWRTRCARPLPACAFASRGSRVGARKTNCSDSAGLVADLQQVDGLFEELLTYVAFDEFDYERPVLQTEAIPLVASVQAVVDEVSATAEQLSVSVHGGEGATIIANRRLFERAVTNLLLNAMAYGEGKIAVHVREHEQHCVVDVQDNGPGIPERDRLQVVKPFVRLGKKKTRGTGLGLAIVTRIIGPARRPIAHRRCTGRRRLHATRLEERAPAPPVALAALARPARKAKGELAEVLF